MRVINGIEVYSFKEKLPPLRVPVVWHYSGGNWYGYDEKNTGGHTWNIGCRVPYSFPGHSRTWSMRAGPGEWGPENCDYWYHVPVDLENYLS